MLGVGWGWEIPSMFLSSLPHSFRLCPALPRAVYPTALQIMGPRFPLLWNGAIFLPAVSPGSVSHGPGRSSGSVPAALH